MWMWNKARSIGRRNCTFRITMHCEWKIKHKKKNLMVKESFAMLHINNPRLAFYDSLSFFIYHQLHKSLCHFLSTSYFNLLHTRSFYQQQKLILWADHWTIKSSEYFQKKNVKVADWDEIEGEREKNGKKVHTSTQTLLSAYDEISDD